MITSAPDPKAGLSLRDTNMHYSVGAVVQRDGKYLLIERANEPFGWAGPAGHVKMGETPSEAIKREVHEETGLQVVRKDRWQKEQLFWNSCHHGVDVHQWYVYVCEVTGDLNRSKQETEDIRWVSAEEIRERSIKLEPAWEHWFWKMGLIEHKQERPLHIVICSSMSGDINLTRMKAIAVKLRSEGLRVDIPKSRGEFAGAPSVRGYFESHGGIDSFSEDHHIWDVKNTAMREHFRKIEVADAILVANFTKHGKEGYVGANTFLEVGHAYQLNKEAFLFCKSPDMRLKEELRGMNLTVLYRDLSALYA